MISFIILFFKVLLEISVQKNASLKRAFVKKRAKKRRNLEIMWNYIYKRLFVGINHFDRFFVEGAKRPHGDCPFWQCLNINFCNKHKLYTTVTVCSSVHEDHKYNASLYNENFHQDQEPLTGKKE